MSILGPCSREFILRDDGILVIVPTEYGNFKASPPELVRMQGVDYTDFQLVEINHVHGCAQTQSCFLGRKAKSPQQIAAEEAVQSAKESLKAAEAVLKQLKEK